MLPTLSIGSIALPTYPLFLLIALWAGLSLSAARARRLGLDGDHIYNAGLYGLIGGIVGARLWFVLAHWENYAPNIRPAFSLSRSALSAEEGMIAAGLVGLIYIHRHRIPIGPFFDALAPGLALALAIGHTGAFLGGEGLGLPADTAWTVEIGATARHPVQLYEAGAALLILVLLYAARRQRPWAGFQFWLLVMLYSLARLLLEVFRARPVLIGDGFLAAQVTALGAMVVALAVMAYKFNSDSEQTEVESYEFVR